ncbi:DUF6343 family protein [Nonomuraea longicatena]|uniref:Integral membrane protein n=1 Tax=Nonomuraea longicatena TaxID=83682 RepID=A0ABN1QJD9_9ACTN
MGRRDREGSEPLNARSPVRARRIMSVIALVVFTALGVFFVVRATATGQPVWSVEAVIAGVAAVVALIDLVVLRGRC